MALQDILHAMEVQVEADFTRLQEQSAATAREIRRSAEKDSAEIVARHHREILAPLRQERARRLNRARLESLRATSQARERLFVQALACARDRLATLRSSPEYPSILCALADEALEQVGVEAVVRADPRDEAVILSLRRRFRASRFEFDLSTDGGVEARTPDGRVIVRNTLEGRLEQAHETLRQRVMPLFANG